MPKLVQKALEQEYRVLIITEHPEQAKRLDTALWTFEPGSFLPHALATGGDEDKEQPVLLAQDYTDANDATLLICLNGQAFDASPDARLVRILDMFDGYNESALAAARARWKAYKEAGFPVSYIKQQANGSWKKEA